MERISFDKTLCKNLLNSFITELDNQMKLLTEALDKSDFISAFKISHTIKGMSANVSAFSIKDTALEIENASKANNPVKAAGYFKSLNSEIKKFIEVSDNWIKNNA
jgi:HPt (histidine-containing phosphotransfer) domain-containing protein